MVSAPAGSAAHRRALAWHGAAVIPTGSPESASAPIQGDWLGVAPGLLPSAVVTGVALEFGTAPAAEVLDALLADNWLHNRSDADPSQAAAVARRVRDAFYIDADVWRGMVLASRWPCCARPSPDWPQQRPRRRDLRIGATFVSRSGSVT